ncbi:uncharacterized protein LOC128388413 isoform X2 [Panonychus citri]|uniref:uncharacterized protein LOC128388413 isoform X2 n=1 Tax=Panonychus citri TaxID=50023 RepID=UPI002307EF6D|nr:uncharacterized protein LOC128388413 isoform X2 [Panonychus citri]
MLPNCEFLLTYFSWFFVFSVIFLQLADCQRSDLAHRSIPWTVSNYPNPWIEPRKCGRTFPSNICDIDKLLTTEQVAKIDRVLWEYGREATCLCDSCGIAGRGLKTLFALMGDADGVLRQDEMSERGGGRKLTWQQFTDSLRKKYNPGGCGNDIVVVISPLGGAVSLGEVAKKILEKSFISKLTENDFPKSQNEQYKFIASIMDEILSFDLSKETPVKIPSKFIVSIPPTTMPPNKDENILIAGLAPPLSSSPSPSSSSSPSSSPSSSSSSGVNTWGANRYIAAEEDDEFKVPEDNKISSSLAFMIVGSLTVILVSLIALFLIIWYYRTRTGNIEPSTMNVKPATDEKTSSDIKSVKYEPCKTDEPGLPV